MSLFIQIKNEYGKTQEELKDLCYTLSQVIDVNKDGKVTKQEWCNWINSSATESLLQNNPTYKAWENLFFNLSNAKMEIELDNLEKRIKESQDSEVKTLF